jgi:predicted membrane channel-forming protein YqfA (hemolysin III family)
MSEYILITAFILGMYLIMTLVRKQLQLNNRFRYLQSDLAKLGVLFILAVHNSPDQNPSMFYIKWFLMGALSILVFRKIYKSQKT